MEKHYLGVTTPKQPREKGKHAKAISVHEAAEVSYKEALSKSDYAVVLADCFNAWLLEAYKFHLKGKAG